ncbi:MAG TPA: PTS lactose/cellobiose transporter subunit IIA [Bacillota bacterium]|nr:PTS lactose/cellobiose transporter subunit IIA [Bacillota bacterium]HOR86508.1 PTS lactose/cellobiose transporter subunit IIA [Bacillota bacterium]HPL53804.1 PTS lactose/cellobiose transporter subunit IIA [Bacillota bacterium]
MEMTILAIISQSGDARSSCMEAIRYAKMNDYEKAEKCMEEAEQKLELAHKEQTKLIQAEAGGERIELSLLLIHAQDHLMNAGVVMDMAREFIDLYRKASIK